MWPGYSPGLYPGYMFMKAVHILFIFSHKNNACFYYCGLSTLGAALGYTQATFSWKLFIFSSHFHKKNNTFSIIGDSQPSVQPWAIPRLHVYGRCSYSLHFFTQKQYICWLLWTLDPLYSPGLYPGYIFHKIISLSFHIFTQKQHVFKLLGTLDPRYSPGLYPGYIFYKMLSLSFHVFTQKQYIFYYWGLSTLGIALGYTQATFYTKCCHFLFACSHKNNTCFYYWGSKPWVQPCRCKLIYLDSSS
jgi:hypothetical protein